MYILRIIVEESAKFKEKQEQQFRQSKHNYMNANTKLEKSCQENHNITREIMRDNMK